MIVFIAKHEQLFQGTTGLEHSAAIEACTAFGRLFVEKVHTMLSDHCLSCLSFYDIDVLWFVAKWLDR